MEHRSNALELTRAEHAAIAEWAEHFNRHAFFEAHEILEGPWLVAREPAKSYLKGLIHAAVALCHYQRGNSHGARVKYASGRQYLSPYLQVEGPIRLDLLLASLECFFAPLLAQDPGVRQPPEATWWPIVMLAPAVQGTQNLTDGRTQSH